MWRAALAQPGVVDSVLGLVPLPALLQPVRPYWLALVLALTLA